MRRGTCLSTGKILGMTVAIFIFAIILPIVIGVGLIVMCCICCARAAAGGRPASGGGYIRAPGAAYQQGTPQYQPPQPYSAV
jgi:hypothetical protein